MHESQAPPHDHAGGAHDEEHNDEGELFPRVLTTRLVGDVEAQRVGREARQAWLLGFGLAVVALGLPLSRVATGVMFSAPLPRGAVGFLAEQLAWSRERTGFALAAVLLGVSVPLITATLRAVGFVHQAAMPATLIAVLSPLAWHGATTAGDFFLGVAVTSWLLGQLFARRPWPRLLIGYAIGVALHVDTILLLPALALGAAQPEGDTEHKSQGARPRAALVTGLGGLALLAVGGMTGTLAGDVLLPVEVSGQRALILLGALGVGLWGLVSPWFRGSDEASAPPVWCLVFLLAPLPGLVLDRGAAGAWLVPLAALGLADFAQRKEGLSGLVRGLSMLAVQLALTLVLTWRWEARDPHLAWRETARDRLEPSDLVVSDDPIHTFLLRERWGVEVAGSAAPDLAERLATARSEGRRIVLDADSPAVMPPQPAPPRAYRLTAGGLMPPETER